MLELAVLGMLQERPRHGYELKQRCSEIIGPLWGVSFGSLYPALKRLERNGAIEIVESADDGDIAAPAPLASTGSISGALAAARRSRKPRPSRRNLKAYQIGSVFGDHERQIIWGVTPDGSFVDGMTLDGFIAQAIQLLINSGRVYRYGNTTVYEADAPGDQRLTTLAVQHRAEPIAGPAAFQSWLPSTATARGIRASSSATSIGRARPAPKREESR